MHVGEPRARVGVRVGWAGHEGIENKQRVEENTQMGTGWAHPGNGPPSPGNLSSPGLMMEEGPSHPRPKCIIQFRDLILFSFICSAWEGGFTYGTEVLTHSRCGLVDHYVSLFIPSVNPSPDLLCGHCHRCW